VSRGWRNWTRSRQWDTRVGTIELAVLRVGEVDVTDTASLAKAIGELEKQMKAVAKRLEFGEAAQLRDRVKELRTKQIYKT
jgi:excinuclease UvrABC helicase subunit UvrB